MAVPSGQLQVGRYFLALAAIVALIYGLVFFTGSTRTPKLGLDLQGGTTVTLKAATTNGKPPSKESLSQARTIIERRVNGSGVAEAEVLTQGKDQLVVSVPGRQKIVQLTSTAQLRFRRVIQAQANTAPAVTPSPGGSPSASPKAPVVGGASPTPSKKRVLTSALVAPTPTPTPTTATSPKPGASSSAAPTDAVLTTLLSRPAETLFADPRMTCQVLALRPSGAVEDAKKKQVACDTANQNKYLLDVAKVLGTDVSGADYQVDSTSGQWKVTVNFKNKGQGRWTDLTREAFNATPPTNRVAIVLDDSVISAPDILGVITGPADISGQFSQSEAKSLANQLKYGALPLHFDVLTNDAVSPTLGTDQLKAGLLAGGIGLALVALYSLLYYRLLGFVTIISLALSGVITYGLIVLLGRQIGFTLTLAGIAGFIVAVGITADSFVVFFERIKDEVKDGRSVRSAIPRAWVRARRTILSADAVSFLAAAALYVFTVGAVKGFAFTLGLSTILDLVVVFLFTHPLVSLTARWRTFDSPRMTGLGNVRHHDPVLAGAAGQAGAAGVPGLSTRTRTRSAAKES